MVMQSADRIWYKQIMESGLGAHLNK